MTAPTVNFVQGDAEWTRLRALALSDLYWFCAFVLGYGERVPIREHMHRAFCRFIERRTGHPALDTAWSASRIVLRRASGRKEPSIFVIGVGGTVTGMHPDIIIVDDMISREAAENARA